MSQRMLDAVTIIVCTAAVLLGAWLGGCGGEGGDVNATGKSASSTSTNGEPVLCDFGDGNTFNFTLGDNAALDFCTEGGGVVTPDNSTNTTDSGNRTSVNGATPTPTPSS
jgi:hypothetical protein